MWFTHYYVQIVPLDRNFVPQPAAQERAFDLFQTFVRDAQRVSLRLSAEPDWPDWYEWLNEPYETGEGQVRCVLQADYPPPPAPPAPPMPPLPPEQVTQLAEVLGCPVRCLVVQAQWWDRETKTFT